MFVAVLLLVRTASATTFLHYSFDDTFADDSGNANDGTFIDDGLATSGFVDVPAAFGQSFDHPEQQEEDRVVFATPFVTDPADAWTIGFWHDMSGGISMPLGDDAGAGNHFMVRADASTLAELALGGQAPITWDLTGIIGQDSFTHYAIVADPAGIAGVDADSDGFEDHVALYVDGLLMLPDPGQQLSLVDTSFVVTNYGDGDDLNDTFHNGHGVSDELWIFAGEALDAPRVDWLRTHNDACLGDADGDAVLDCYDLPALDVGGVCPGKTTLTVSGLSASGNFAILTGTSLGAAAVPAGPCAGAALGISGGLAYRPPTHRLDAAGNAALSPTLPAGACGLWVQVLDLTTCAVTPAQPL